MEFTDRLMATDRSVANYRRFAHVSNANAAKHLILDLLHWHGRFADFNFTPEKAHDMLIEILNMFLDEHQTEKEADTPLRGEREEPTTRFRVHDEVIEFAPPRREVSPFLSNGIRDRWQRLEASIRVDFPEIDLDACRTRAAMMGQTARFDQLIDELDRTYLTETAWAPLEYAESPTLIPMPEEDEIEF